MQWRPKLLWLIGRAPYMYLLRVPLLTAAALLLLPVVALNTSAKPLLANLFDLQEPELWGIVIPALTTAWAVLICSWLIVLYGSRRFKVPRIQICFPPRPRQVFLFSLLAVPIVSGTILWTISQSNVSLGLFLFGGVFGLLIALYLVYRCLILVNLMSGIADWITPLAKLGAGYTVSPLHAPKGLELAWRSEAVNKFGRPVYRDPKRLPGWKTGRVLLPGHALALASVTGFLFLYLAIGIGKWVNIGSPPLIPTLGYVLLLLTIACFGLTGMTFFFDRYRIPVLLPVLAWCLITSQFPDSDHFFPAVPRNPAETETLSPATALRAGNFTNVLVVAANGGGIQAASWTAQVLTGLEQKCRDEVAHGCRDFSSAVRLISAVSGGSVGAMYFAGGYDPKTRALPRNLAPIRERAEASSLDDIAWGLAYADLWRMLIPWFWKGLDRGMALENALTRDPSLAQPLSDWRAGVRAGWRPATVFNATAVETGERLLLSTTDMPPQPGYRNLYGENFAAGKDVKLVTAARLSASFPFVTPAARANLPGPHLHIADGGYYDNYGISTLIEWLNSALAAPANPVKHVMIIEIRGAPNDIPPAPKSRGWFYQAIAPFDALLSVRTAAQFAHNQVELDLLTRLWSGSGQPVQIQQTVFQFCGADPPLSWHLSPKQKGAIADAWQTEVAKHKNWERITGFLEGNTNLPAAETNPCASQ